MARRSSVPALVSVASGLEASYRSIHNVSLTATMSEGHETAHTSPSSASPSQSLSKPSHVSSAPGWTAALVSSRSVARGKPSPSSSGGAVVSSSPGPDVGDGDGAGEGVAVPGLVGVTSLDGLGVTAVFGVDVVSGVRVGAGRQSSSPDGVAGGVDDGVGTGVAVGPGDSGGDPVVSSSPCPKQPPNRTRRVAASHGEKMRLPGTSGHPGPP